MKLDEDVHYWIKEYRLFLIKTWNIMTKLTTCGQTYSWGCTVNANFNRHYYRYRGSIYCNTELCVFHLCHIGQAHTY